MIDVCLYFKMFSSVSILYNHTPSPLTSFPFITTPVLPSPPFHSLITPSPPPGSFEGLSRAELMREVERREAEVLRLENQHIQLTEALGRHSEQAGEGSALLQVCLNMYM